MNFFDYQEQARRKTIRLVFYYIIAVFLVCLAIHLLVSVIAVPISGAVRDVGPINADDEITAIANKACDPLLILIDFSVVAMVIGLGTLIKTSQLKGLDGDGIARSFGGEKVFPRGASWKEKRLLNIVEEMAIASGVTPPGVYVMRNEPSINAFAAGFTQPTSVIAVTQGAIDYLTRDELQGVIGHEFSHLLNQDTRLNMKLIGVLFGLEMIALFGLIVMRIGGEIAYYSPRSRDRENNTLGIALAMAVIGLVVMIIGLIGQLAANIIRSAVSRQREFLADASSVQFTRNPQGLAGALKKIGSSVGARISSNNAVEASHIFFANIFKRGFFSGLFNSHPDLTTRIRRLEPNFDGVFPKFIPQVTEKTDTPRRPLNPFMPESLRGTPTGTLNARSVAGAAVAAEILAAAGPVEKKPVRVAQALRAEIPRPIEDLLQDPEGGTAALLAVLLDNDTEVCKRELLHIRPQIAPSLFEKVVAAAKALVGTGESVKLPIVQKAFPLLRALPPEVYQKLRKTALELINFDGHVDLLEFTIFKFVFGDLDVFFRLVKPRSDKYGSPDQVFGQLRQVASHIAYAGSDDRAECERGFSLFCRSLNVSMSLLPKEDCTSVQFSRDLDVLAQGKPLFREKMLEAFYACVNADGYINEREGELIRAITACFHAPMPNWDAPAASAS